MPGCSFCHHQLLLLDANPEPVGYKLSGITIKPWLLQLCHSVSH